ncbi:MAG: HEPN domain-containing protein [Chloroflexota bacterium]
MQENDPLAWVAYAEEDLAAAQAALRARKQRLVTACFHSQQCAEKYLKALLLSRAADFPKTHDLIHLNNLCRANGILTEFSEALLGALSLHATVSRYPGEEPTLEEAREAMEIAKTVRKFARKWLGIGK